MVPPRTFFIDIDGTLLHHYGSIVAQLEMNAEESLLPDVWKKLIEWDRRGDRIILTTGRKESSRRLTERQLEEAGIVYDLLIMGLGPGQRILINDLKPDRDGPMAIAINLKRNEGLQDVEL